MTGRYEGARAYIAAIRNPAKKAYAEAWARYMQRGGAEPDRGGLSVMAAQAVRMWLAELMPQYGRAKQS